MLVIATRDEGTLDFALVISAIVPENNDPWPVSQDRNTMDHIPNSRRWLHFW